MVNTICSFELLQEGRRGTQCVRPHQVQGLETPRPHEPARRGEKYQFINRFASFARNTKVAMPTAPPSQLRDEGAHSQRKAAGKDSPPPPNLPQTQKLLTGCRSSRKSCHALDG